MTGTVSERRERSERARTPATAPFSGDTYIKISGFTCVTAGQGKQVVEQLHSKL
jgi:hypothetical protein